jgi:16S rRNA (uracil1498-N3)-methyltransferase
MPYFLAERALAAGESYELTGEEARHAASSRRMRPGETLSLQDPEGNRFRVIVEDVRARGLRVRVAEPEPVPSLPPRRVTLLQAAAKAKAAELIVQKCTELGVAQLEFFPAAYSTVAQRELQDPKTLSRWERIAWEACKQCGRQFPPSIRIVPDLAVALSVAAGSTRRWLLDAAGGTPAQAIPNPRSAEESLCLLVGPEGGFTPEELNQARAAGFDTVSLGSLTLRAETAALAACTLALFG